jgi:8-amino-7-oxononanoate synthase
VEGIYSMQGDAAPLTAITDLCEEFGAALMVDEAHSIGLLGGERTGLAELCGVADRVTIRMGTFSKALASTGGFIAGPRNLIDQLRIGAHSFIFSMAAIPASVAAALAAVRIVRSSEGAALAEQSLANADLLRTLLSERGVVAGGASAAKDIAGSPIVSVVPRRKLGGLATWHSLLDKGIFTGLAAFPAVAAGDAILRMSVMASHSPEMLTAAADAVAEVARQSD